MNPPPLSQHLTKASYTAVASAPPWDTIVIGSGMGGLAAAGMLAKQGERVLVLEKHSKLGGCTHEFEEKGVSFDTGLHYVGGQVWLPTSFPRRLFDHITDGAVEWIPMDDAFDVAVVDGKRLDVRGGETQIADLINRFPRDATKIRAYYAEIEREAGRVGKLSSDQIASGYVPHAVINAFWDSSFGQETVAKALDRLDITDVDLRKFLTYLAGDYGAFPDEASFTQHAITVMHYFNGAAYPRGGPAKIAEAVARVVTKSEGACLTRAPVQSLLLEKGKVTGVVLAGHDIPIRAAKVISCVGAINTFTKLFPGPESGVALPALVAQARESIDKDIVASTAHCMLFAVLRGTKAELELPAANWWINSTRDGDFPSAFISFPSAKDPETWAKLHPDVSTCEVTVEADYDEFARWAEQPAKNRDADYAALKESWAKRMLDVLYAHFPQLKGKVDFYDASTPLSTEHNLNSVRGSAYGVKCTPARYRANRDWLKPGTSIPGLYLGGQDVLSCGVVGALVGGAVAACAASTSALLAMRPILHPIDDLHLVAHPGPEHKAELGVVADAEPEKEGWF